MSNKSMSMELPLIYVSRMEVSESYFDDFMTWCKMRHWPDVLGVGFLSANGYLCVSGAPRICNVYEIPGVEVFSSAYDAVRANDEQLKVIVAEKISKHSLTVYSQVLTHGLPQIPSRSFPSLSQSWSCPAMSSARFDLSTEAVDAARLRGMQDIFSDLALDTRLLRARFLKESSKHPTYPSPEPAWSVLIEWADLAGAENGVLALADALKSHFGISMTRLQLNAGQGVFSLRHPSRWKA